MILVKRGRKRQHFFKSFLKKDLRYEMILVKRGRKQKGTEALEGLGLI